MNFIASRKLLFAEKGEHTRREIEVRISAPYVVQPSEVSFPVDGVVAGCRVEIVGLDEPGHECYGVDALQAVNLASDIEALLERLGHKYDFFWITGEPYFEE